MTTKTKQEDPQVVVDRLDAGIEELERQRAQAIAQMRRTERRFEELEKRRSVLSPKTFAGDKKATEELEALEDEHDELARSSRVAKAAIPEIDRMLEELREQRTQAQRDVHMHRESELAREADSLNEERDELAGRLYEILERQDEFHAKMIQAVSRYDQDRANGMVTSEHPNRAWLRHTFSRWIWS